MSLGALKTVLISTGCGGFLGGALASVMAPKYLAWDNTPRQGQSLCNCAEVALNTAHDLLGWQLKGALLGAVLFLVLGILWVRGHRRPAQAPPAAPGH